MKTVFVLAPLMAFGMAGLAAAQQAPEPTPPAAQTAPRASSVSEEDLDTFATIYVDLLETAAKFQEEMQNAASEEEAEDIQNRMRDESTEKVARHGWTPDKFNAVAEAINADPALAERTASLIEQKS
jgi:hypothetical protein